jgi:Mobilization protein NikA
MTRTRALQVRLTRDQHELLKALAARKGFPSLAAYLRYVGLNQDFALHDRVAEIHRHLLGEPERPSRKGRRRHDPVDGGV